MNRKLSFTIADGPVYWKTHRIMELCDYLSLHVLEPMCAGDGLKWNRQFMDFFTFDNGCDPMAPTGTIRFEVPPLFAGRLVELETTIRKELGKLNIKLGPFRTDENDSTASRPVLLIQVLENPTALQAPPEVNMSQTRGCLVMRDLLGYQKVNGRYEFAPDDLVQRVASVTEEKIAACTASPVKVSGAVRRTPSQISMKAIRRCLEEVRQFGIWAMDNNHRKLAAA
jgi:hypothetical protein